MTFETLLFWVAIGCVVVIALAVVYLLENPDL